LTSVNGVSEAMAAPAYEMIIGTDTTACSISNKDADIEVPEDIKAIADERWAARQAKDWATADALRGKLAELGWAMKDGKDGYKLTKA
ncbi:MAG: hypothetical protein IJ956_03910, partial [Akkermansia sp.]|nr:hypothetical protein [Akkermansia sp.]